jgi:hypothetical protein
VEHQLWTAILPHLIRLDQTPRPTRHTYSDSDILAVYLWAVLHDRTQAWACDARNWPIHRRRRPLPSESTLSKRLRTPSVLALFAALFATLTTPSGSGVFWMMDGKPLPVSGVSGDTSATWGRGAGGLACGYKLHAILNIRGEVAACEVAPMNVDERVVAQRLLGAADLWGYVVADANYDSNRLHDCCDALGNRQLITPRRYARTAKSTGHRPQSAGRLRCLALWAQPAPRWIDGLLHARGEIERRFGTLVCTAGGLGPLPAWVRTLPRVDRWVRAKLLIHTLRRRLPTTTYDP